MSRTRYLIAIALSLTLAVSLAPAGRTLAGPAAATVEVAAADFEFQPQNTTVNAGDTVTWRNTGQAPHTVTASDGSWDSGNMDPGATFSMTFDTAGTISYYCKYHGNAEGAGMAGTITVQAQATPEATPQATPEATPAATPQATPEAAPQPTPAQGPTPLIEASSQQLVNNSVTVARVVAAQDGWVVIHTNSAENKPGPVIGQTFVSAGEHTNVQVQLSQTPAVGDKLWPMLHIDAGTAGAYEFPGPDLPVTVDGRVVMVQITVTGRPSITAHDQPIVNNSVTVANVVALQDSWVVIHTNTAENKPGPVIGQTFVSAGEHSNVHIQLNETPAVGDKLWPMLHVDAGTAGAYEFPGPDLPVTVDGQVVMVQFTVTELTPLPETGVESRPAQRPNTAGTNQPAQLPNTGSSDGSQLWLLGLLALGLLACGALVLRRRSA